MSAFSDKLKQLRLNNNLSVNEVVDKLNKRGVEIGAKAFYHWEAGRRMPDADEFIYLCEIYGVESFSYFDETKKSPAPEGTEDEEQAIDELEEELRSVLLKHGLLQGGDITPDQNAFLKHVFALILAYFQKSI